MGGAAAEQVTGHPDPREVQFGRDPGLRGARLPKAGKSQPGSVATTQASVTPIVVPLRASVLAFPTVFPGRAASTAPPSLTGGRASTAMTVNDGFGTVR